MISFDQNESDTRNNYAIPYQFEVLSIPVTKSTFAWNATEIDSELWMDK